MAFSYKKLILVGILTTAVFAGGIVHNLNQGAKYIGNFNRNASTEVDAVFFNPAGLALLPDGLYLTLSNQTILQDREIKNDFALLNTDTFKGEVSAPFFPNIYLAYKTGKMALSAGLVPIGGGGSADYPDGLPMLERDIAVLVGLPAAALNPALAPYGNINSYTADTEFNGSSVYLGGQFGLSYQLNDEFAFALGTRLIYATNTYEGKAAYEIFTDTGADIAPLIGYSSLEVDAGRTGTGFTGIISVFYTPNDQLGISARYETITKLDLTNDTEVDEAGLFPDGEVIASDMPALLSLGASYDINDKLNAQCSFNYYFNEDVDWDGAEELVDNGFGTGFGFEYIINEDIIGRFGYLYTQSGANEEYQNNMDWALGAHSIGLGLGYQINEDMLFNFGGGMTSYIEEEIDVTYNSMVGPVDFTETYNKSNIFIAIGLDYTFPNK